MNVLYTGYDLQNLNKIEYVPSQMFKNLVNDVNVLKCGKLRVEREDLFKDFRLGCRMKFGLDENNIFTTTDMISKIKNEPTDLLKGIDDKGSQHLSRMIGVESSMKIHTFNPEILIQKLEGVSEQSYKLKTIQENVDKIED